MSLIREIQCKESDGGWTCTVRLNETRYTVTASHGYIAHMESKDSAGDAAAVEALVRRSFEFLLERESKESILRRFDLKDIRRYFPDYEKACKY